MHVPYQPGNSSQCGCIYLYTCNLLSVQEFEYWVRRNPKILDTLLSFQPRESRGTLGPLLLSPDEGSGASESTVSVPLHPSPLPPITSTPLAGSQGSLEVTHTSHIRPIRSEPALVTMATDTTVSQRAFTTERSDVFNRDTVSMVTKVATSTDPVAIEIGASSPTLVSEPDTPLQSGTGTSFTVPATAEPEMKFITSVKEEGEGEGKGEKGEGDVVDRGGEGRGRKEGGEQEYVEAGQDGGMMGGGGGQAGSIMQSQDALPLDMNFDLPAAPLETLPYTPSSPLLPTTMETVALEIQEEVEEEAEEEEQIEQALPLVDIGDSRPLSISESPRTSVSGTMPLLSSGGHPLEQGEHQLEVTEHQPQDSDNCIHKLDVHETGISSFHPLSEVAPSDVVFTGAVATHLSDPLTSAPTQSTSSPHLLHPSLHPQPCGDQEDVAEELQAVAARGDLGPDPVVLVPRRPSPFPEVVEGVREALYTAWIPSPWTQGLLSQPSSMTQQHLTCPGLVADIKMVRGSSIGFMRILCTHFRSVMCSRTTVSP